MTEPKHNRGKSKQDYITPVEFTDATKGRLCIAEFSIDLAADARNAQAATYFTAEQNALAHTWNFPGWAWCNPPWGHITPWVRKAYAESRKGAHIAMLLPAGVGSDWFREHVNGKAFVLILNGRIKFVGADDQYTKDCMLLLYGPDIPAGYEVWTWNPAKPRKRLTP